ncbi:MAG: hypothetical protein IKF11_09755 [Methanobrevibacter sp.]|nr:hypothetical protein [Methanobrevibacter sp.]
MTTKTFKYKSKIATAISFLAALIVYLGQDGLKQIMPVEYASLIPVIILIAGYILTQTTENKRVEVAEQMIYEKYENPDQDTIGWDHTVIGDENDGC